MAWITPKTDWHGATDETGEYQGDRFNAADYNRIKNNIRHLRDLAVTMYVPFGITDMGRDKNSEEYAYADEIVLIENNLETVAAKTLRLDYGKKKFYTDNTSFIDYAELNRIESATLDMFNKLTNQFIGRKMLRFMFGPTTGGL